MSSIRSGDAWSVHEQEFPRGAGMAEQLAFLLRYAVLAPSARNTQPWKFAVSGDTVDVCVDTSRWQRVSDADQREMYISAGCALENLVIAARHFRFGVAIGLVPEPERPDLAARVRLTPEAASPSPETNELFLAIRRRFTNHGTYDGIRVAERQLDALRAGAAEPGLALEFATDAPTLHIADELVMRADAELLSDHDYRHELGAAIGTGAYGAPWLLASLGRLAVSYLNPVKSFVAQHHAALVSSPVLGLITAAESTRETQVRAGQMLERIYLLADGLGLCLQPLSQLMQSAEVREALASLLGRGRVPLQPFRLGHASPPKTFTTRRPLAEVIA